MHTRHPARRCGAVLLNATPHTIGRCTPSCDDRKICSSHPTASTTRAERRSDLRRIPCPPWANTAVILETHHSRKRGARGSRPWNITLPLPPLSAPALSNTPKTGRSHPGTSTRDSRPTAGKSTLRVLYTPQQHRMQIYYQLLHGPPDNLHVIHIN